MPALEIKFLTRMAAQEPKRWSDYLRFGPSMGIRFGINYDIIILWRSGL